MSVELVEPSPAVEGDPVTVCGRLRFEGSTDELQCAVTLNLNTTDGKAAGRHKLQCSSRETVRDTQTR